MGNRINDDAFSGSPRLKKSAPIISGDEATKGQTANRFATSNGRAGNKTNK